MRPPFEGSESCSPHTSSQIRTQQGYPFDERICPIYTPKRPRIHLTATEVVWRPARARLEFALRFAQLDLGTLREGDRLNLGDDLEAFLGIDPAADSTLADRGGIVAMPIEPPLPKDLPDAAVK